MSKKNDAMRDALLNAVEAKQAKDKKKKKQASFPAGGFLSLPFEQQIEVCPCKPVGINGSSFFYVDASKQLRELAAEKHSPRGITSLFVPSSYVLPELFPHFNKNGDVDGFDCNAAANFLMDACARKGIWDSAYKERGVGAWPADDGGLVFHCGDKILRVAKDGSEKWFEPGEIDEYIYPAQAKTPRPAESDKDADADAAELRALFEKWNFAAGRDLAAHLLVGWVGAAMLSGALDWRPSIWIMARAGSGKSTLQNVIRALFGKNGIVKAADATEAGIRQTLKNSTLPVSFDEAEAEEENKRQSKILALVRIAASGDVSLRGSEGHSAKMFALRSPFFFSSILPPPMENADADRILILSLKKADGVEPIIDPQRLERIGQSIKRRMIDGWPYFRDRFQAFRERLAAEGIKEPRYLDQFGTLLACADIALHPPKQEFYLDEEEDAFIKRTKQLCAEIKIENESDAKRCLNKLMTSVTDTWRSGSKKLISELIDEVRQGTDDAKDAEDVLERNGMRIFSRRLTTTGVEVRFLFVANQHDGLRKIFDGTKWAGKGSTIGGWVNALRQLEVPNTSEAIRCGKMTQRGTTFVLDDLVPAADGGADA